MPLRYLRYTILSIFLAAAMHGAEFDQRIARIEQAAKVRERMRESRIPAVSIAVVESGKLAGATAFGTANVDTVFQAASISKPVAAMAALHMSQNGNFTLDEDVNGKLKSWKLPENELTRSKKVTLRGLLSHSAGLTVHGFPGYANGATLPSLVQIFEGNGPANTKPIRVDLEPGSKWRYSGGGYTLVQQMMMDRMGWPFPQIMERMVLSRAGMKRSSYEQPPGRALAANAATAHKTDGAPIEGRWRVYPEMAAAGLWTTPADLAHWAIELREAYYGRSNKILERTTAREMLTRQKENWGLGPQLGGKDETFRFQHGGSNAGFRAVLVMLVASGQGAVIMTNSDNGGKVFQPLLAAVAAEYGWPADWEKP
jgi:CubicO group peptidase (beta-lactamase class C family)